MRAGLFAIAFLVELAMLGAAGWWGFTLDAGLALRLLAGLGAPLLIAVVWGFFCSPRARVRLAPPAKYAVQAACFLLAGGLLAVAGHPVLAVGLVALWAVDRALLSHGGHPA